MTKRRAVQIFIVVGVMVLTGFISIFCMLTAITLFILNIYIRERHMRKRFNPWKDTRRNFDAIVIGERYDLRRLHLNGIKGNGQRTQSLCEFPYFTNLFQSIRT